MAVVKEFSLQRKEHGVQSLAWEDFTCRRSLKTKPVWLLGPCAANTEA